MSNPRYKIIDGFSDYRVGDDGTVWSKKRGLWRLLSQALDTNGYPKVTLFDSGTQRQVNVHRLVLEAFVGPCPENCEARHFPDRRRVCNSVANLSWATKLTNISDQVTHGTRLAGESKANAKISNKVASSIVQDLLGDASLTMAQIAKRHSVSESCVAQIRSGGRWQCVSGGSISRSGLRARGEKNGSAKLTEQQVVEIRQRAAAGETFRAIADDFDVKDPIIFHIARGNSWKHVGGPILTAPRKRGRRPAATK